MYLSRKEACRNKIALSYHVLIAAVFDVQGAINADVRALFTLAELDE